MTSRGGRCNASQPRAARVDRPEAAPVRRSGHVSPQHRARTGGYALGVSAMLFIYVGGFVSTVLNGPGWREGVVHLLFLAGVMAGLIAYRTADHLPAEDRDRLRVLAAQVLALTLAGSVAELMWEAKVGDLPVVLTLTLVVTWTLGAEALAIRFKHAELAA